MRTSATGTSASSSRRDGGFTLVEILVVVVIIGVLAVGAVLALGAAGGDRDVTDERDRLEAMIGYFRERAEIENREYGLRLFQGGYEVMVYDDRAAQWTRVEDGRDLRGRRLPPTLEVQLTVEGRPLVIPAADTKDLAPQILLFSSGDLNDFDLTMKRRGDTLGFRVRPAEREYDVQVENLPVRS